MKLEIFSIHPFVTGMLWFMNDDDLGLNHNGTVKLTEISIGIEPSCGTVCTMSEHPPTQVLNLLPALKLRMRNTRTLHIFDVPGAGLADNLDVNEAMKLTYVPSYDFTVASTWTTCRR